MKSKVFWILFIIIMLLVIGCILDDEEEGQYLKLQFSTVDYQGNPVDESILKNADVTMVNYWETWCVWCLKEMPGCEEMYEKYADEGFQIIGVYTPQGKGYSNESNSEEVKKILDEYGIKYTIVEYCDGFEEYDQGGRPVSFFVDSEGRLLSVSEDEVGVEYAHGVLDEAIERYEDAARGTGNEEDRATYNSYVRDITDNYDIYVEKYADEIVGEEVISGYIPDTALNVLVRYYLNMN